MTDPSAPATPPASRLTVFYVVLAALTAAVAAIIISIGTGEDAQPEIAGGYDVAGENACLGPQFDLKQSGQFVNLENADETLGGRLRFEEGELTGDVDCISGGTQDIDARVEGGTITGTLAGEEVSAEF